MPGEHGVDILEESGVEHVDFSAAALLGRSSVVADAFLSDPRACISSLIATAARAEADPSRLWPQPWPGAPATTGDCVGTSF